MSSSAHEFHSKRAGLTLIELLISMLVGGIILTVTSSLLVSSSRVQVREQRSLPLQESVRGAMELMSMELREANGPRLVSGGAGLPAALTGSTTGANRLSIVAMNPDSRFAIPKPNGYPNSTSYPNSANTPITSPNDAGRRCSDVFRGGEWALVTVGTNSWWVQSSVQNPCASTPGNVRLLHNGYQLPGFVWNPNAQLVQVNVTEYYLGTTNGTPALLRRVNGAEQIVAFDVTTFTLQYSSDGVTFSSTAVSNPTAVRVTIGGQVTTTPGAAPMTYSLTQVVFMRKTTIPAPTGT